MRLQYSLSSCILIVFFFTKALAVESGSDSLPNIKNVINGLPARCVGFFLGQSRYSDLTVFEKDPRIFYVASANGGVLKTEDGGRYFDFVFDKIGASSVGAIAVNPKDHNILWVATGEGWQRNSVGIGNGIYKTENSGKTWQYMGLKECVSFSKIIIHPTNDKIIYAAGLGSAWGGDKDRGVYKSEDGGKMWNKVLFVNETTGVGDLIIDARDPDNLIAGMWDHVHRPYGRRGGGPGSGIYKSKDGGKTWKKIIAGLPQTNLGRIGLDYFRANPKLVVAAIEEPLPGSSLYRSDDGGETWRSVPALHQIDSSWGFTGMTYNPSRVWYRPYYNQVVRFDPKDPNIIYHGNVFHYSKDGGKTFVGNTSDDHGLWINPKDPSHSICVADGEFSQHFNVHPNLRELKSIRIQAFVPPLSQIYNVGYDMRKIYSVMGNSQDGDSRSISTQSNRGYINYSDQIRLVPGAEGGKTMADPENWKIIYSLGPNGTLKRFNLENGKVKDIRPKMGGWRGYARADEYELYKNLDTNFRGGWNCGFLISPWNSSTLFLGANCLFKSVDKGETWSIISPDLTHNKKEWQVPDQSVYPNGNDNSVSRMYQTIRTVSESPLLQGVIWVGTDDGYVQLTKDGGKTWTNVTANIKGVPEFTWVSHLYASKYASGRAYATFDGHRNCDLKTYVYVTEDYGKTWTKITGNLPPNEPAYVIKEGLRNPELLYVGTEFGLYISLDRGKQWEKYQDLNFSTKDSQYFPTVAIHDLEIHPRELDLIVGTHGRSIWIIPTSPLEELTQEYLKKEVYFTKPNTLYLFPIFFSGDSWPFDLSKFLEKNNFVGRNTQPGSYFSFYLKDECNACEATISISDASGNRAILGEGSKNPPIKLRARAGLNTWLWSNSSYLEEIVIKEPGDYKVTLSINGKKYYQTLHVEDATDEMLPGSQKD